MDIRLQAHRFAARARGFSGLAREFKPMLCLAKSYRQGGYCVAGVRMDVEHAGEWLRPVGPAGHESLSRNSLFLNDGKTLSVGDIVGVPVDRAMPDGHQMENWSIQPDLGWQNLGRLTWADLKAMDDGLGPLWRDGPSKGRDRIWAEYWQMPDHSLRFVHVENMRLEQVLNAAGSPRVDASFVHAGRAYRMRMTDPYLYRLHQRFFDIEEAMICVSLTQEWNGYFYKLVASVITPNRIKNGL